ncbi:putative surface protease GP63 [Trypanosoma cruzi]|nr:putative surface protease GP63 [Trypanosoma cruzi]
MGYYRVNWRMAEPMSWAAAVAATSWSKSAIQPIILPPSILTCFALLKTQRRLAAPPTAVTLGRAPQASLKTRRVCWIRTFALLFLWNFKNLVWDNVQDVLGRKCGLSPWVADWRWLVVPGRGIAGDEGR